jgi:uncharacterized protein YbaP (TraB family)
MKELRLVRPSVLGFKVKSPVNVDLVADMISSSTEGWTVDYLQSLIANDEVPKSYIDTALSFVGRNPILIAVQKEQFLSACQKAKPELYEILLTPEGDQWLDKATKELAVNLFMNPFKAIIPGG